ncbi:MAG TPA: S1/P1 nuclease [Candidatus Dormibacteraeota bacterium]|nr:S1/P1 nuclease [Candidatus Dormibacteraeota bacterium]
MKKFVSLLVAAVLILLPTKVHAWGVEGHEVVAALAESMLSDAAKAGVKSVLGDVTLYSVANWADQVRNQRDETYNWHFVDIPRSAAGFLDSRDCFLPTNTHAGAATDHMNCVVDRITYFKQILADPATQPTDRQEALKFIVHFVGDIHQPFHAIGDELGGNLIHITEFGSAQCGSRPCNLHSAWDTGMIEHTGMDRDTYVQHLQLLISSSHLTADGTPENWANESHDLGNAAWLNQGGVLDDAYYNAQIQVVDKRLALAALRLAALLEDVYGSHNGGGTTTPTGQKAVATRNVNLRTDPSTSNPKIETLHKGDQVTLMDTAAVNGFYHVQAADGKQGYVYAHYVKVQHN